MVTGDPIDRLLEHLEIDLDAARAADEDAEATSLASSLIQGLDIAAALKRSGGADVLLPDGRPVPVDEIGIDYVVADGATALLPLSNLVARAPGAGERVFEMGADVLVTRLRRWLGRRVSVDVGPAIGPVRGRLAGVGPEHLEVRTDQGRTLCALGAISAVRLCRED